MRVTVIHNGILVQHAAELDSSAREWSLGLQDHLNPTRFRNIWIRKLNFDTDAVGTPPPAKPTPAPKKSAAANRVPAAKMLAAATAAPASVVARPAVSHPFVPAAIAGLDEGEHLLATLSCVSCHSASGVSGERFVGKKAPLM